jgi:hypothetical protein
MEWVILFCLGSIGLTHAVVYGKVFNWLRDWIDVKSPILSELIHCPACSGFWLGMISACFLLFPLMDFGWMNIFIIIGGGWVSSYLSSLADVIFQYLESKTIIQ